MRLKLFISIALLLVPLMLMAQGRVTVSGTVTDKNTGEPLPSATVSIAPSSDRDAKKYTSTSKCFFSYTKSDFDCEYIALNQLIFKSVYTRHNVSSDVIVRVF